MGVLTIERLAKVSNNLGKFAPGLLDCEKQFEINTINRAAHFLAQLSVESARFTRTAENMRYSTAKRIKKVFSSKVTLEEAKELTFVSSGNAEKMKQFYDRFEQFFKVNVPDHVREGGSLPAKPRDATSLTKKVYGSADGEGRGLIQMPLAQRKQVLKFMCEEYRKSTAGEKPAPLKFIESLQGVPSEGEIHPKVLSVAESCDSLDAFVDNFGKLLISNEYVSAVSAGAYWYTNPSLANNLNKLADGGEDDETVAKVSGAVNRGDPKKKATALEERTAEFRRIVSILRE